MLMLCYGAKLLHSCLLTAAIATARFRGERKKLVTGPKGVRRKNKIR